MINRTVFGCRSNCGAKAWRDQATGAVQSRSLLRTSSKGQIVSVDAIRGHGKSQEPCSRSFDAHRFRPLQILARGPAGNEYT